MTLTLSGPDRLQQQLRRDSNFLHRFYLDSQMQLNSQLQACGVAMVHLEPLFADFVDLDYT